MVMGPGGRLRARHEAPFHVQLELEKTRVLECVPGDMQVSGRAVRVFRTDGRLAVGDHLAFTLWICRAGDEPTGPAYIYYDDFMGASYMEVYLYGSPPDCQLAGYELSVVDAPSDEPKLPPDEFDFWLKTAGGDIRWWQFWKRFSSH